MGPKFDQHGINKRAFWVGLFVYWATDGRSPLPQGQVSGSAALVGYRSKEEEREGRAPSRHGGTIQINIYFVE